MLFSNLSLPRLSRLYTKPSDLLAHCFTVIVYTRYFDFVSAAPVKKVDPFFDDDDDDLFKVGTYKTKGK